MGTALCSIIIPTYNHANYIERSIISALEQTYQNKEIIVVDDGSTDDTAERVSQFESKVVYIKKGNTGRGDNRNVAIRASNGKYIQFLDADDYLDKRKLELQITVLENDSTLAAVYSDCSCTGPDGKPLENVAYPLKDDEDQLKILLRRTLFGIHAALVRKSVIVEVGMFDTDPLAQEDWDLWLKIALKGYRYKYIPGDLAHYDQVGSATVTNSPLMYKRTKHMLEKYMADPQFKLLGKSVYNYFVANQSLSLATRAYNNRWWSDARKYFIMARKADVSVMNRKYLACIPKTYLFQILDIITKRNNIPR